MQNTYTTDWVTSKIGTWEKILKTQTPRKSILEVGSYEGRATCWFIENLLDANGKITCIENWKWGDFSEAFKENTKLALLNSPMKSLELITGDSNKEIPRLILNGNKYDLIYIDGEFSPINRVTDCFMAWQVLDLCGILIIDDYLTKEGSIKTNIDSFCNIFKDYFKYLYVGNQIIIKKIKN